MQVGRTRVLPEETLQRWGAAADAVARTEARVQRTREHIAESRRLVQQHGPRRTSRLLRLLISARIDEGRLPQTIPALISGVPGLGGACEACGGYLPASRLMMMVPDGKWTVYVHADCYMIWKAQCRRHVPLHRAEWRADRDHSHRLS